MSGLLQTSLSPRGPASAVGLRILVAVAGLLGLAGCPDRPPYDGAFDVPIAAAVLQPEVGGPFLEPVGFVANGHGGQIVQLALKQGRFLTDDRTASFLRANQLPTGGDRLLTSVAAYAPSTEEVTVFAGDRAFGQLLAVPYVVGVRGGDPVELSPSAALVDTPPTIVPLISVKTGYTTTETWTLTWDEAREGGRFVARGSRSGLQPDLVAIGEPWSARERRLNLTLLGSAADLVTGDQIVVRTNSGLREIDVGGAPLSLALAPDQSLLALIVQDASTDQPRLWWFDPATEELGAEVALPTGAEPHRLAWSEDGLLLVADRARAAAYSVAPGAATATEYPLPWPTLDVDSLVPEGGPPMLYVVPIDGRSFWLVDRDTGALVDVNPLAEGLQGQLFRTPIHGIEAMEQPFRSSELSDDGIAREVRAVAITDGSGSVVFAHEDTGCLVHDLRGPRTNQLASAGASPNVDVERSFEEQAVSGPTFLPNASNSRSVLVNPCGGIAQEETWIVVYDAGVAAWRVEGSLTGEQQSMAYAEQRYVSDLGEVSFTIRSGALPPRDGWQFTFSVQRGIAEATGDLDNNNQREQSFRAPGDLVAFYYRVGLQGAVGDVVSTEDAPPWYDVDIRPFVLIPGGATNSVGRVNPQIPATLQNLDGPEIEVGWD